jgi:hypothetical protein
MSHPLATSLPFVPTIGQQYILLISLFACLDLVVHPVGLSCPGLIAEFLTHDMHLSFLIS